MISQLARGTGGPRGSGGKGFPPGSGVPGVAPGLADISLAVLGGTAGQSGSYANTPSHVGRNLAMLVVRPLLIPAGQVAPQLVRTHSRVGRQTAIRWIRHRLRSGRAATARR